MERDFDSHPRREAGSDASNTEHASLTAQEQLRRQHALELRIDRIATTLKVGGTFTSIIVTIVAALVWYFVVLGNLNWEKSHRTAALVELLRYDTDDVINQLVLLEQPREQYDKIEALLRIREHIDALKPDDASYRYLSELVDVLDIVRQDSLKLAHQKTQHLTKRSAHDPFVYPRALVIEAMLDVSPDVDRPNEEARVKLEEAIRRDGGIAIAFNVLGILSTNSAIEFANDLTKRLRESPVPLVDTVSEAERDSLGGLLERGQFQFRMAIGLDPSAIGMYRYLNNRLWNEAVYISCRIDKIFGESEVLRFLGATSVNDYFRACDTEIRNYEYLSLDKKLAIPVATKAQIYSVQAQYHNSQGDTPHFIKRALEAKELQLSAITLGLYKPSGNADNSGKAENTRKALARFNNDRLLRGLRAHKESCESVVRCIEKWCRDNLPNN